MPWKDLALDPVLVRGQLPLLGRVERQLLHQLEQLRRVAQLPVVTFGGAAKEGKGTLGARVALVVVARAAKLVRPAALDEGAARVGGEVVARTRVRRGAPWRRADA